MTSRNQREGHYDGYFRKHYRSRFHRLGRRYEQGYISLIHAAPDLTRDWTEDTVSVDGALAIGELGKIDHFRFVGTQ